MMNAEKLKKMGVSVRTGGKGSVRRKKLIKSKGDTGNDKNLKQILQRLQCQQWNGVEEVKLFHNDRKVTLFVKPTVRINFAANLIVVTGQHSEREIIDSDLSEVVSQADISKLVHQLQSQSGGNDSTNIPEAEDFEAIAEDSANGDEVHTEDVPALEEVNDENKDSQ